MAESGGEEERLARTRVIGSDGTDGSWRVIRSLCAWISDIVVLFDMLCISSCRIAR